MAGPIYFSQFVVTSQVFFKSALSYSMVNLKPLLPGHVLVCPLRVVERVSDLTPEESADLFVMVHKVSKVIEAMYKADALNITIQDGALAGQSVPHVHCHIIPRRLKDLPNVDDIYKLLDSKAADLSDYRILQDNKVDRVFGPDSEKRPARPAEEMAEEAQRIAQFMKSTMPNL